jgi:glycosyltransferase involved in cell wall biosynthesis
MRIVILQGAFLPVPPIEGGAVEKLWYQLGKQFASLGHEVFHISKSHPRLPDNQIIDGVHYIRIVGFRFSPNILILKIFDLFYSIRALFALPKRVDILVSNTFWMPLLLFMRPSLRPRIVVSVERMPRGQMFLYRHVDLLRCCSSSVMERVLSEQPQLASKTVMIPNPLPFAIDNSYPPYSKKPIILYCGRIHPEKGLDLLVRSFVFAQRIGLAGWTLRIVGPSDFAHGGGGSTWLSSMQQLAIQTSAPIEWIDPIYDDLLLQDEYRNAAIFVYPSHADQGEAMPLAPLEAMAHGTVPIVSALNCFNDYIFDGVNGLIFNHRSVDSTEILARLFVQLSSDPDLLSDLSRAASHVRDSHGLSVIAAKFTDLFNHLLVPSR